MNISQEADLYNNNEIRQRTSVKKFEEWHESYKKNLTLRAKLDGEKNNPEYGSTGLSLQEQQIQEAYKSELQKLIQPGLTIINGLNDGPLKTLKEQLEQEDTEKASLKSIHLKKIEQEAAYRKSVFDETASGLNKEKQTLENDLHKIETSYRNKVVEHNREHLNNKINPVMGWILLIVMGIIEAPLNAKVFEYFKLSSIETYITALIVIIGFPMLSHFGGKALHKGSNGKPNFKAALGIFMFIFLFCFVLNWFRVSFMDDMEHLGEKNYAGKSFIQLIANVKFLFSFALNIALFLIGILISYYMHDTDIDFEKVFRVYHKKAPSLKSAIQHIEEDIRNAKATLQKETDRIEQQKALIDVKVAEELKNKKKEYSNTVVLYDRIIQHLLHLENVAGSGFRQSLLEYRKLNELNRTEPVPELWKTGNTDLEKLFSNLGLSEINPQQ